MRRFRLRLLTLTAAGLLVVSACTPPKPAPLATYLDPAGPVEARVGTSVTFEAQNFPGAVEWAVDGVVGGAPGIGSIADGLFVAPSRVPAMGAVVVSATSESNPSETATASVTITAPGTVYILDETIYVLGALDTVEGDVAADRTFTLAGPANSPIAMAGAPALDLAFIAAAWDSSRIVRVNSLSTATGEVTGTEFSTLGYTNPTGLAYDQERDILYALFEGALVAYHGASTAGVGAVPDRVVAGPSLTDWFVNDSRLALDVANDRLFLAVSEWVTLGVYDDASALDGEVTPDRTMTLDAPANFFWGLDYDASRDELYVGDQKLGVGVYVVANASAATGLVEPSRSLGGPTYPLQGASQVIYDVTNDRLVVIDAYGDDVKVYDDASTLNGDVAPTRVIGGPLLPIVYPFGGFIDPAQ
ncbi:MAG TPA: hypothetical protein VFN07_11620 [Trueperaceae bacterium]|nr:hypothetical protein [Trueperaceae bacterium]